MAALDSALFTLYFNRRKQHPWITDIYSSPSIPPPSSSSTKQSISEQLKDVPPAYTRQRATSSTNYKTILLDGIVPDCILASITSPSALDKIKNVQLHNPPSSVSLEKAGMTFYQDWKFTFGEEVFSWRKSSTVGNANRSSYVCNVIRKPDPSINVAEYRPSSKSRLSGLTFMDHNLDRIDVQDKKGLEIVLVLTLCALLDQEYDERVGTGVDNIYVSQHAAVTGASSPKHPNSAVPAPVPKESGPSQPLEPNQVLVTPWGLTEEYVSHCLDLLRAPPGGKNMLLIEIRSESIDTSAKAIQVAAGVKAGFHRLSEEEKGVVSSPSPSRSGDDSVEQEAELYQYVKTTEEEESQSRSDSRSPATDQMTTGANSPSSLLPPSAPKKRIIKLDPPSPSQLIASPSQLSPIPSPRPPPLSPRPNSSSSKQASANTSTSASNSGSGAYLPPKSLVIYLSKERIPDLEPPPQPKPPTSSAPWNDFGKLSIGTSARPTHPPNQGSSTSTASYFPKPTETVATSHQQGNGSHPPSKSNPSPSQPPSIPPKTLGMGKALLGKLRMGGGGGGSGQS
ncbi:hypothetical protein IE53DRAFT_55186 [Violaceomyces palustris]|uniref:Uncharacterized protein n=1 Tax=Violaceomyces palustris TaxID=1673888 RepID=A0ACD0NZW7_9BASI|nr:hypothetical protein IE53DRAFT_55186 [Violaceomyces palustris]